MYNKPRISLCAHNRYKIFNNYSTVNNATHAHKSMKKRNSLEIEKIQKGIFFYEVPTELHDSLCVLYTYLMTPSLNILFSFSLYWESLGEKFFFNVCVWVRTKNDSVGEPLSNITKRLYVRMDIQIVKIVCIFLWEYWGGWIERIIFQKCWSWYIFFLLFELCVSLTKAWHWCITFWHFIPLSFSVIYWWWLLMHIPFAMLSVYLISFSNYTFFLQKLLNYFIKLMFSYSKWI